MEVAINNFKELLGFIKKDEVNSKQASEIVCKALNIYAISDLSKNEVIEQTEFFIITYCQNNNAERPIFLDKIDFDIV
jgi:hypothetical protein